MSRRNATRARWAHAAPIFAALGDETRLALVSRLGEGPLSITRLTEGSNVTRQAITKHLEVLSEVGLVRDERNGRQRLWVVESAQLEAARRCLDEISAEWDAALLRLKDFVET